LFRRRYAATLGLALRFTRQLWWLSKMRPLRSPDRHAALTRALYRRQAQEFREFATRMGGLIIKVGQFMSVRVDMLPKEYIDELGQLQDSVPPVSSEQIIQVVETELGGTLQDHFQAFELEPIAAASLGQVHRARLLDGTPVAVKILRPGIEELVNTDLRSLRSVLTLLSRFTSLLRYVDADGVYQDFELTHRDELDYLKEAHNAEQFQRNFLLHPAVEMPQIYWSHTTAKVLTMEFMAGVKINDFEALDAVGVDRGALAQNLMEIYLQMLLQDGFFHADPHPGNVLVRPDGVIQLIDFGMVGNISEPMRQQFTALVGAFFQRDAAGVVHSLQKLGFVGADADTRALKESLIPLIDSMVADLMDLFRGSSFLDLTLDADTNTTNGLTGDGATLDQLREVILTQPVSLPGQVSFLGKALITVISNCFKLDPNVDLLAIAQQWIKEFGATSVNQSLNQAATDAWALLRSLPATAQHLVSLAQKLDDAELEVRLSPAQLRQLAALNQKQTTRLMRTIAMAAALLAAVAYRLGRRA
jgi:predicted unusual protein kinase regulating ubiquinone biosynthesis (AarF/ABC1/UbiB family)